MRSLRLWGILALLWMVVACDDDTATNNTTNNTNNQVGLPVLKKHLDVDLNTLESLVVLDDTPLHKEQVVTGLAGLDGDGNIVGLELLETTTGESFPYKPWPMFIAPTNGWILLLFNENDLVIHLRNEDETFTEVMCHTLAARRADGALFCSDIGFVTYSEDNLYSDRTVKANKSGDILYTVAYDPVGPNIL